MQRTNRQIAGSALVEFAVVSTMVFTVLFGLIEMGMLFKDVTILNQAVLQGARAAGIGQTPTQIRSLVTQSAPTLDTSQLAVQLSAPGYGFSTDGGATYTTLGVAGANNNAPSGSLIKIQAIYQHKWLTSFIFRGTKQMSAAAAVRRE